MKNSIHNGPATAGRTSRPSGWLSSRLRKAFAAEPEGHPSDPSFSDLLDTFLSGKELSDSRKRHYRVLERMVIRYESYVRLSRPGKASYRFLYDGLDSDTLCDLKKYLKEESGRLEAFPAILESHPEERHFGVRSDNYLSSLFKMLRAFLRWCVRSGYLREDPFRGFPMPKEEYGTPVILSLDEVRRLYDTPMPRKRMEQARDVFVFQCMVGARVGDMMRFTRRSVQGGRLEYIAGKTMRFSGRTVSVPLNATAKEIVRKYRDLPGDRLLPLVSEQNYNARIKDVFTVAGLTRLVTEYDPVTRSEVKLPLNRIASSHLARRTFVGNIYRRVKDPSLVCALSGHAEGSKAFARYREIDMKMKKDLVRFLDGSRRKGKGMEDEEG